MVNKWPLSEILHFELLFRNLQVPNVTRLTVTVEVAPDIRSRLKPYPPPSIFQQHFFEILSSHPNFASVEHFQIFVNIGIPAEGMHGDAIRSIAIPLQDLQVPSLKLLELESDFALRPFAEDDGFPFHPLSSLDSIHARVPNSTFVAEWQLYLLDLREQRGGWGVFNEMTVSSQIIVDSHDD